jgi:hypothetical protein
VSILSGEDSRHQAFRAMVMDKLYIKSKSK